MATFGMSSQDSEVNKISVREGMGYYYLKRNTKLMYGRAAIRVKKT